jgi:hypothetical protein
MPYIHRVGQNRICTPYMAVCTAISLLKVPCIRMYVWFWPTQLVQGAIHSVCASHYAPASKLQANVVLLSNISYQPAQNGVFSICRYKYAHFAAYLVFSICRCKHAHSAAYMHSSAACTQEHTCTQAAYLHPSCLHALKSQPTVELLLLWLLGTYVGLARTIYLRRIHATFGREITKHSVIHGV